jgi:hypothetical protein
MATFNQLVGINIQNADLPFKNYSGSDIPSGTGVLFDTVNKGDVNNAAGIVVPTAAGGVVKTAGVTIERIPAGQSGRVRMLGAAVCVASGTLNPGDFVQVDDTGGLLGNVKAIAATNEILGRVLSAAVVGDPVLVWVLTGAHN